ncbi:hypothetical protein LK540_20030 [Massilia sp. IC2-278]|nr:hypothetical protein [Massilia sp. IC2-278]
MKTPVNTPGRNKPERLPEGVAGWSWGGFVFSWIWAIPNRTWWGLLGLVPGVGLVVRVLLGLKGRQSAWRNGRWDSLEHFRRVQRRWSMAAGAVVALVVIALVAVVAHDRPAPRSGEHAGEQLEL